MIVYEVKDLLAVKILLKSDAFPPVVVTLAVVLSVTGEDAAIESFLLLRSANVPFRIPTSDFNSSLSNSNSSVKDGELAREGEGGWREGGVCTV